MNDIYYSPEKYGLTSVGEVEWSSGSYEFDLTAVWRDNATGTLKWAEDVGCSCPSPFEECGLDDLTTGTWVDLKAHLDERNKDNYGGDRSEDIATLIGRIVNA